MRTWCRVQFAGLHKAHIGLLTGLFSVCVVTPCAHLLTGLFLVCVITSSTYSDKRSIYLENNKKSIMWEVYFIATCGLPGFTIFKHNSNHVQKTPEIEIHELKLRFTMRITCNYFFQPIHLLYVSSWSDV